MPRLSDIVATRQSVRDLVGRKKDKKAAMLWWDSFDEGAEFGDVPGAACSRGV